MPVVKRYPNRKLYDTQAKQYITLDGIAELIRQGDNVQVIDHASGEDLTALTLTQIIFEQEKKQSGLLPLPTLTGLIRTSGTRLTALQKSLFSSTFRQQIDEEIRSRLQALVQLGEINESEYDDLLEKLLHPDVRPHEGRPEAEHPVTISAQALEAHLQKRQIPTQADLRQLYAQLEALAEKLEEISPPEA
jgi:polyhydroxyalkanoate synthesis repressor PhaR